MATALPACNVALPNPLAMSAVFSNTELNLVVAVLASVVPVALVGPLPIPPK